MEELSEVRNELAYVQGKLKAKNDEFKEMQRNNFELNARINKLTAEANRNRSKEEKEFVELAEHFTIRFFLIFEIFLTSLLTS